MNVYVLIAGIFATMTTLGHFILGRKLYLLPMLQSNFDEVARKVMHSVFHYVSVFLISSSLALLAYGLNVQLLAGQELLIKFIAINYAGFALWQIIIALTSNIPKSLSKLFQWLFFVLIALFAWMGV